MVKQCVSSPVNMTLYSQNEVAYDNASMLKYLLAGIVGASLIYAHKPCRMVSYAMWYIYSKDFNTILLSYIIVIMYDE